MPGFGKLILSDVGQGRVTSNSEEVTKATPPRVGQSLYGNSGVLRFDGRSANATITSEKPYEGPLNDPATYTEYFSSILTTFSDAYTFGWSPEAEQMVTYDETYHRGNNYTEGNEREISIKEIQVR